jgi:hypothetical protein
VFFAGEAAGGRSVVGAAGGEMRGATDEGGGGIALPESDLFLLLFSVDRGAVPGFFGEGCGIWKGKKDEQTLDFFDRVPPVAHVTEVEERKHRCFH